MLPIELNKGALQTWPSLRETPGYKVMRGDPQPSGRLDTGSLDSEIRVGIWACTEGAFECTETGDELQTIVSGRLRIVESNGIEHEFSPGDSFFTRKGERLLWDVLERVEKVFFTYNRDGTT